jgi:hypothetical protein
VKLTVYGFVNPIGSPGVPVAEQPVPSPKLIVVAVQLAENPFGVVADKTT